MRTIKTESGIIILVVAAIIAVLIVVIFAFWVFVPEAPLVIQVPSKIREIAPPPATGNIDDAVEAFLKELTDEELLLTEEEGDTTLINTDSQEIGDFGQSIDEKEL